MYLWRWVISLGLIILLGACTTPEPSQKTIEPQANYWKQFGPPVTGNNVSLHKSYMAHVASDNASSNVYVREWNGFGWSQLGDPLDKTLSQNAVSPRVTQRYSSNVHVAFSENVIGNSWNIYVKYWNGFFWQSRGAALDINLNRTAQSPDIAMDVSGNPLATWRENDGTSYNIYVKHWNSSSFSWQPLGGALDASPFSRNAFEPSIALDNLDKPVVSWSECFDANITCNDKDIWVKKWNGTAWELLGGQLDINPSNKAEHPSLAINQGTPIVAWHECTDSTCTNKNIYVKTWDGTNWIPLGTSLDINTSHDVSSPSLSLNALGNPVVSWFEFDGTSTNVYVKQWTGTSWSLLGATGLDTSLANNAYYPSVSDFNGNIQVAWQEGNTSTSDSIYVKQYFANSWQDLGGPLNDVSTQTSNNSAIARKTNNLPVVAWDIFDTSTGSRNIYVKEWSGSAWIPKGGALDKVIGASALNPSIALRSNNTIHVAWSENDTIYESFWNGTTWVTQGNANGGAIDTTLANFANNPSLAMRTDNLPVIAFSEEVPSSSNSDIRVRRLVANTWTSIGGVLDVNPAANAGEPSLALKTDNNPVVAWTEAESPGGFSYNIYAKEWNGTNWIPLGGPIDRVLSNNAKEVVLAIGTDDKPVVAWNENGNIYVRRWNGTNWLDIGGVLNYNPSFGAEKPSIDIRSDNNPVVTWMETSASNGYDVWVKRWTGSKWVKVSNTALDRSIANSAYSPALVLKSNNNPILSFNEWDGTFHTVYVRQF